MAQEFITRIDPVHLKRNEMARQKNNLTRWQELASSFLAQVVHSIGQANKDPSINYRPLASFQPRGQQATG